MAEKERAKQLEEEDKEERVNTRVNKPLSSTSTSLFQQSVTGPWTPEDFLHVSGRVQNA